MLLGLGQPGAGPPARRTHAQALCRSAARAIQPRGEPWWAAPVDDRSQGLPYDFAALCPTPAGGLPNDLAAFLFGLLHVFIHVIPPC